MKSEDVKRVREKLNLTQDEFAKAFGLSGKHAVSNIETGFRNPSQTILQMLNLLDELPKKAASDLISKLITQAEKNWSADEHQ